jgi:carbonic anhydrase/acetyltransferase-like protein (isoleucine patch superfamily)
MAMLIELDGVTPTIGNDVFLAPTAVLIGDVRIGDATSVWYGAVLRGDFAHIEVGAGSSIQDNAVLHCAEDLPTIVGDEVTVGHGSILEGCVVEEGAVIGMGSIVCQRARVGAASMLAAGSVLAERAAVGPQMLAAGVPAREKKTLDGIAAGWTRTSARVYQRLSQRYRRVSSEESDRA